MMFRHQEIMKVYFQLGSKFNLPNDLVYFLYKYSKEEERRMIHETKIFYKNILMYKHQISFNYKKNIFSH